MVFRFSLLVLAATLFIEQAPAQELAPIDDNDTTQSKSIDELLGMEKIQNLRTDIHHQVSEKPVDRYATIQTGPFQERVMAPSAVLWDAPNICYHPLYFEDVGLERYSQRTGWFQPALSTAHFFGRTITLPLHMMVERPFSCEYPLGFHRPGSCNPYVHYSFPW